MVGNGMNSSGLKRAIPWLLLFLGVLLPLYAVSVAFAIRSGLFDLQNRSIGADEYKAIWTFIASGFATAITIVGLLFTRSHNERTSHQLALDTVVKGLDLLVGSDGKYAPSARIAGALAALVHLGHPAIAMRTLSAAWSDEAVDPASACWLIGEVLRTGSSESKLEAAGLLRGHVNRLTYADKGTFEWPDAIWDDWPQNMQYNARYWVLLATVEMVLSRDKAWWGRDYNWTILLLDEARRADKSSYLRDCATIFLRALLSHYNERGALSWKNGSKDVDKIRRDVSQHKYQNDLEDDIEIATLRERIESWG
jgi:hypothetical protein